MRPPPLPVPLLVVVGAALWRPLSATILVIQQRADAAEYQLEDSPSHFGPHVSMTGIGVRELCLPRTGCLSLCPSGDLL